MLTRRCVVGENKGRNCYGEKQVSVGKIKGVAVKEG